MNEPSRRPSSCVFPPAWTPPTVPRLLPVLRPARRELDAARAPGRRHRAAGRRWPPDRFDYPSGRSTTRSTTQQFNAFADLTDEARHLQGVLSVENDLTARIRVGNLGNLSLLRRARTPLRSRAGHRQHHGMGCTRQLGSITVSGRGAVILSSNSGPFSVTVDQRARRARCRCASRTTSTPHGHHRARRTSTLHASSTTTKLLEASTDKLGVHNVTISLTDRRGEPARLPASSCRSARPR
jgi:hypothetical protein